MTNPYAKAVAARDAAEAKIHQLEQRLMLLKQDYDRAVAFIEGWAHFAGEEGADASDVPPETRMAESYTPHMYAPNPTKELVAAKAAEVLKAAGRPMSRSQLYEALKDQGVVINAKDVLNTMGTMLFRMKDVVINIPGVGYWPAGVPLPNGRQVQMPL